MKSCICVISSKNPNEVLLKTVNNVKLFYPEFDIVIIDSDSTNTNYYDCIQGDVKIEYCKNKNWELGAWYYAFDKYHNYDIYMFIQDSLIPISRIPNFNIEEFVNGTLYSFHYNASICDGGYFDEMVNIYRDTDMSFISEVNPYTNITGTAHTSFITNRENVYTILKLEEAYITKNIEKTKIHSWLSERCGGFVADRNNNIRIDINPYFQKLSLMRDYL